MEDVCRTVWPFRLNKNRRKQNDNIILSHTVYVCRRNRGKWSHKKAAGTKPYFQCMTCLTSVMYLRNNYCTHISNFTSKNKCELHIWSFAVCMHGSIAHTGLQAWLELHHPLIVHQTTTIHLHRNNNTYDVKPNVSTIIDIHSITLDVQLHSYSIVTNHWNPSVAQSFSQWEDDQTKAPECINSE